MGEFEVWQGRPEKYKAKGRMKQIGILGVLSLFYEKNVI